MKIEVSKKHLFVIVGAILVLTVTMGVIAYGTSVPGTFGHSAGEVEGVGAAQFGGAYGIEPYNNNNCLSVNPETGACSCPSGGYIAVKVTGCTPTGLTRCGFVCVKP